MTRKTQPAPVSELPNLTTAAERSEGEGGAGGGAPAARQAKRSRTNDEGEAVSAGTARHTSPIAFVDDTGIEPVTSSVSGKRATAAPIVQGNLLGFSRWRRDSNPCTRLCRPLPRLSATPPLRKLACRTLSERTTGFEPATSTLARLRSTN